MSQPVFVVAVDGSPQADGALRHANNLAEALGARLRVVTVTDISMARASATAASGFQFLLPTAAEQAALTIESARTQLSSSKAKWTTAVLPLGEPARAIVAEAARCGATLIIVGSHGRRGLARVLLGSVAEKVVRQAPCSVLVVRE